MHLQSWCCSMLFRFERHVDSLVQMFYRRIRDLYTSCWQEGAARTLRPHMCLLPAWITVSETWAYPHSIPYYAFIVR
jgi:hypothetical protein